MQIFFNACDSEFREAVNSRPLKNCTNGYFGTAASKGEELIKTKSGNLTSFLKELAKLV